jgi:hypothetical protein
MCVSVTGWMLRAVALRRSRLSVRRERRGYRRGDSLLATARTPWYVLVSLPGAVFNAGVAVTCTVLAALVATVTTPPRALVEVLALAGLVMGAVVYWGPFSRLTRDGCAALTAGVLRSRTATLVVVGLILAGALALLVTRQVTGPRYSPLPAPPWASGLRGLLP